MTDIIILAHLAKEVRDLQKAYFASGGPRYRDKKLLAASKVKEIELDLTLSTILAAPEATQFSAPAVITSNAIWDDDVIDVDPYR